MRANLATPRVRERRTAEAQLVHAMAGGAFRVPYGASGVRYGSLAEPPQRVQGTLTFRLPAPTRPMPERARRLQRGVLWRMLWAGAVLLAYPIATLSIGVAAWAWWRAPQTTHMETRPEQAIPAPATSATAASSPKAAAAESAVTVADPAPSQIVRSLFGAQPSPDTLDARIHSATTAPVMPPKSPPASPRVGGVVGAGTRAGPVQATVKPAAPVMPTIEPLSTAVVPPRALEQPTARESAPTSAGTMRAPSEGSAAPEAANNFMPPIR